jgi:hypothetical protein
MKKPKKLLKDLGRLGAYLKKESTKIEKILSRSMEKDGSPLLIEIIQRLAARREAAMTDLGLVSAAQEAASKGVKVVRPKKPAKKANKKPAKTSRAPSTKKTAAKKPPAKKPNAAKPARARKATPAAPAA